MQISKYLIPLLLVFGAQRNAKQSKSQDYIGYALTVMRSSTKKIAKELNLVCDGSGGGMPYNVREMELSFVSYQKGSIEKARELVVKATGIFLKGVNSNEKIRPFLDVYPFTPDRAQISISFAKKNSGEYKDGSIVFAFQVKNRIYYCSNGSEPEPYQTLYEEPYEEALRIVQSSEQ